MRCVVDRQKRVAVGDFAWCLSGSNVGGSQSAGCVEDSSARDRYSPASRRFPRVLALEITTARRPAQDRRGHSCALSRYMSVANPLWGAPRIHGELLKLGLDVGQTTIAKYMTKRRRSPSLGCKTFLRNHADGIASIDTFVVPRFHFDS